MNQPPLPHALIGIDVGTTSVKSVLFALDGTVLASASRSIETLHPSPNASEANMDEVWALAIETLQQITSALHAHQVIAIGVTGQGDGAWYVDRHGRPIGNAVLWNDGRSKDVVQNWSDTKLAAVKRATGSPLFPGALPAIWERDRARISELGGVQQLNCKDWIRYNLTGTIETDPTDASRTYLDVATGEYSRELAEALGHPSVLSTLPVVRCSNELAGFLRPEIQNLLGLNYTVPVAVGAVDVAATGVGLGATEAGDSFVIFGTTAVACMNQPSPAHRAHPGSILLRTGRGTQALESLAQMSGMPNLQWARNLLGLGDFDWPEIETSIAQHTTPGLEPIFLPYTAPGGERAPFVDPDATGAWVGARVTTGRWDMMAAVYRGLVHSVYELLQALGIEKAPPSAAIAVSGGGASSLLLCQLLADLSGRTVSRQTDSELGARGAASFAFSAISPGITVATAASRLQTGGELIHPDPTRHESARKALDLFVSVRDAIRPTWADISDHALATR